MIYHYFRMAVRQLKKNRVQYSLSVIGVALGLLCFSLTNYYMRQYFSQYTAWPHAAQMASFRMKYPDAGYKNLLITGEKLLFILDNGVPGIEKIAIGSGTSYNHNITFAQKNGEEMYYRCKCQNINENFPEVFSMRTINGGMPRIRPGEVLISESCSRRIFGNKNPIGYTIHFTQAEKDSSAIEFHTITAIVKDLPVGTREQSDLYFPFVQTIQPDHHFYNNVTALLSKDVTVEEVNARLKDQLPVSERDNKGYLVAETFRQQMFETGNIVALILIPLIGSLVLIAALINMLKFCIQSFYNRTRELAIRKSIGSSQGGLFGLLFAEVVLLLFLSTILLFCMTELFLPFIYYYAPVIGIDDPDYVHVEPWIIFRQQAEYLVGLFVLCAGIAWGAVHRLRYISITHGIAGRGKSRHAFRNVMLGLQLFICFLFMGGGLGMTTLHRHFEGALNNTLTKEECDHVLTLQFYQPQFKGHEEIILSRIRQLSSVEDIMHSRQYDFMEEVLFTNEKKISVMRQEVEENYAAFMKLPVRGRMPRNTTEAVVSNALMQLLEKDSLSQGKTIQAGENTYQITGVYEQRPFTSFAYEGMWEPEKYNMISGLSGNGYFSFYVKSVMGQKKKAEQEINTIIREWLPATIPFEMGTLTRKNASKNGGGKMVSDIFLLLSAISLMITVLGIYSAITLDTRSRQKEVAIRKVNGAGAREIVRLFSRLYIRLLAITAVLALPIVYFFLRFTMGSNIYQTHWLDKPLLWIGVILIVSLIVAGTVALQIWRVSRLNPAEIIKTE